MIPPLAVEWENSGVPVPKGLSQVGMQRLGRIDAVGHRTEPLCLARVDQGNGLSSIEMIVIKPVCPGLIPGPVELNKTGSVQGTGIAAQRLFLVNAYVVLEVGHYQLAQAFMDRLTKSKVDIV
jgi:hypothetical protein